MHPDRDYYPKRTSKFVRRAPNWGLKISNLWLSCVEKFRTKSGSLSVWLWFKRDEILANSSIKQKHPATQRKAKPSQAKPSHRGKEKEQRERTQVPARKEDMMFGITRRFTCPETLPVESTKVEICMFGIKRRFFTCLENLPLVY